MKFMIPLISCILFLAAAKAVPLKKEPLKLASDEWCPYICVEQKAIKSGFLVDVVAAAMAKESVSVSPILMPLNRSIIETASGSIDGVYAPSFDPRLDFSEAITHSRACFYTATSSKWKYSGLNSLKGIQINVIADYGYDDGKMDKYLLNQGHQNQNINFITGETAGAMSAKMLVLGRVAAILEHENTMAYLAKNLNIEDKIRRAGCLEKALPLVLGFAKTENGKKNISLLHEGLQKLKKTGEFKALKKKYNLIER